MNYLFSTPKLRNFFYGTAGDMTNQAGWLLWGAGNIFLFALLD